MKKRKVWLFCKSVRAVKDIFISKLQITENHEKLKSKLDTTFNKINFLK